MDEHEHEREVTWLAEIEKNRELRRLLDEAEQDLLAHKTSVTFGLQETIEKLELRIAELEVESQARKDGNALDLKLWRQERQGLKIQIELLEKKLKMLGAELRAAQQAEARVR